MTKVFRLPDVMATTGLSRSSIYAFIKTKNFPKPLPLSGARAVGWLASEIEEWIQQQANKRGVQS